MPRIKHPSDQHDSQGQAAQELSRVRREVGKMLRRARFEMNEEYLENGESSGWLFIKSRAETLETVCSVLGLDPDAV